MPPSSDGVRTVGCALSRLIPDVAHLGTIQGAVLSVHRATILATELLNMHLRRCLKGEADTDLASFFDGSWILNAYNEVSTGKRTVKVVPSLRETRDKYMPSFSPPDRTGIQQCLLYDARNLATVAATGVWMHFKARVLSHVKGKLEIGREDFNSLSSDQRRERKLLLLQLAADIVKGPTEKSQAPEEWKEWVEDERRQIGIDVAVGEWGGKPLLYHLKARPHRFLPSMYAMSKVREENGKSAFSLYPLRRSMVPKHARFDQKALRDLLRMGNSDHIKKLAKERSTKKRKASQLEEEDEMVLPPLQKDGMGMQVDDIDTPKVGKRRTKEEMRGENEELFAKILDLRAAGVQRRHRFDFAFTTDGVCARVQMKAVEKKEASLNSLPKRGMWAIDELKRVSRLEEMHIVGVDPGKRELVVCADMDSPRGPTVRYTQKQRLREMRSRQYSDEGKREKPWDVKEAEEELAGFNSRSIDLSTFCSYCKKRREKMEECLSFCSRIEHRKRRWKASIKEQQSEERLFKRLKTLQTDSRPLVLAYGSWGLVAGRANAACRGNPPCIGVGLMRKLSRRFLVSPTPEAYTSKTCCRCFGEAGPWKEMEEERGKRIRGLRRCTQRDCMLAMNRDKMGAINIGANFLRLMEDRPTIRTMTEEDLSFHRASLCMGCE